MSGEWSEGIQQDLLVEPVGFAQLPLDPVTLHSPLEMTLGHGDEELGLPGRSINHAERKSREGTVSAREESLDGLAAAETLALGKGMNGVHCLWEILFFLVDFLDEGIEGPRDAGILGRGSFQVQSQTGVANGLGGGGTEAGNG